VGYDTAERIFSPRYYSSETEMLAALKTVSKIGSRFLVGCRVIGGELKCLDDLVVPDNLLPIFSGIPASMFRLDISSTELRKINHEEREDHEV
jgi:hypothetical protein